MSAVRRQAVALALAGEPFRQGWVGLVTSDGERFSIGLAASPLDPTLRSQHRGPPGDPLSSSRFG